ncbi:hypothetical protein P3T25_009962 [Paraburkholderia sp. GAS32]
MSTTNISERSLRVVTNNKPNVLTGLNQNGTRLGMVSSRAWTIMDSMPPAHRTGPHHPENHAEQGKPVSLPHGQANRKESYWRCG